MASGLIAALPITTVVNRVAQQLLSMTLRQSILIAGLSAATCGALDFAVYRGHGRPWSVGTQVPSIWGHTYGPWKAGLRYGLRLGVGPATILTSWTWWGAMAITATSQDLRTAIAIAAVFVIVRSTLTMGVGSGVSNGVEMAKRMQLVIRAERCVTLALTSLMIAVGMAAIIAGFGLHQ